MELLHPALILKSMTTFISRSTCLLKVRGKRRNEYVCTLGGSADIFAVLQRRGQNMDNSHAVRSQLSYSHEI